jgi:hypothetical protein
LTHTIEHITKKTLETGLIQISYITYKGKGRGGKDSITTYTQIYPKELADLIIEK